MFCPQCHAEFVEGVSRCANCEVDLVDEIPRGDIFESPETMAKALEGEELQAMFVGAYSSLREAQQRLADVRIPSVIAGEAEGLEVEAGLHARFFLMVPQARLEDVREYIDRQWKQGLEIEGVMVNPDAEMPETGTCPACQTAVPDDVAECPECGLALGAVEEAGLEEEQEPEADG
jgi:hypothetical protein